jgi:outer membrane lipoprotein carrier protein
MDSFVPRLGICFCVSALLGPTGAGPTAKQNIAPLVSRFESRYRAAHTLQATFLERYSENGRVVRVEAGTAYFRRSGKMRWEYESPEKNLFLVDGKSAWFYVPADHTVFRVPAKESTDSRTPLALLAGEVKVSRVCAKVEPAHNEPAASPDNAVLYCKLRGTESSRSKPGDAHESPQDGETGEAAFFEIVRASGELVRVKVRDSGGVEIEFQFTYWRTDPILADALFRFDPPRGVAIVDGGAHAANAFRNQ